MEVVISRALEARSPLIRVLIAWGLFITVDYGYWAILTLFMFDRGGAALASAALVGILIPGVILGPPLGSLGDRFSPAKVLPATYAAITAILCGMFFLMANNASTIIIILLAGVLDIIVATCEPVHSAILPHLTKSPSALVRANSLTNQLDSVGIFIGPVLGGLLIAGGHFDYRLAVFVLAMIMATALTLGLPPATAVDVLPSLGVRDSLAGLSTVAKDGPLLVLILMLLATCTAIGSLEILSASFATTVLSGNESTAGLLIGASGIGAFIGAGIFAFASGKRFAPYVALGMIAAGIPLIVMAGASQLFLAFAILSLAGLGMAMSRTAVASITQRVTTPSMLTRIFAIEFSALELGWILGLALSPFLIAYFGPAKAYVPIGLGCIVIALICWPIARSLDARMNTDSELLTTLRFPPFIAALHPRPLHLLARTALWSDVSAGMVLCHEGVLDDTLIIVASGRIAATSTATRSDLGPGDWFEEETFLHNLPSTATLTAETDCRILIITREAFISSLRRRSSRGATTFPHSDEISTT
jgi:MFS family permease